MRNRNKKNTGPRPVKSITLVCYYEPKRASRPARVTPDFQYPHCLGHIGEPEGVMLQHGPDGLQWACALGYQRPTRSAPAPHSTVKRRRSRAIGSLALNAR